MDKPIINKNQADRIWAFEWRKNNPSKLLEFHVKHTFSSSKCLQSLSLDELARCLYVGYEVEVEELEPQFEVGDKVFYRTMDTGMHTIIDMQAGICNLRGSVKLTNVETSNIRHATESEIVEEEKRRMDKKINEIWIDLSDYGRNELYKKLVRGDY